MMDAMLFDRFDSEKEAGQAVKTEEEINRWTVRGRKTMLCWAVAVVARVQTCNSPVLLDAAAAEELRWMKACLI